MSERTPSLHPASRAVKRQNVVNSTASRPRAGVVINPHDNIRTVLRMPTHIRVQYNGTSIAWARSNLKPMYATTRRHLHSDLVEMGLVPANVANDAMSLSALFPSETAWLRVPPSQWQALVRSGQIQALKVEYRPQPEVPEEEPGVEPSADPGAQPE